MAGFSVSLIDRHVGSRLQARRVELGIGVEELADSLGVEPSEVERFEAGTARLDAQRLLQACRTLKTDVSYFFAGFGAPAPRKAPHLRLA